jgi:hypothetical protein
MVSFVLWLLYFCSLGYCLRAKLDSMAKKRLLKHLQEYYCLIRCDMQSHRYLSVCQRKPICSPPSVFKMEVLLNCQQIYARLHHNTSYRLRFSKSSPTELHTSTASELLKSIPKPTAICGLIIYFWD